MTSGYDSDRRPTSVFTRRAAAFFIDVVPLTLVLIAASWNLGYGEAMQRYMDNRGDLEARAEFLEIRNLVRFLGLLAATCVWVAFEPSPLQASPGKRLMGLKVIDEQGGRITLGVAVKRNLAKIGSVGFLCLGCLWAAFDRRRQSWHDKASRTYVVKR